MGKIPSDFSPELNRGASRFCLKFGSLRSLRKAILMEMSTSKDVLTARQELRNAAELPVMRFVSGPQSRWKELWMSLGRFGK